MITTTAKKETKKKLLGVVLCCLITAVLFTACAVNIWGDDSGKDESGAAAFTSAGGEFQLTAGKEWQAMTGELHPEAELEIGSLAKDKYLILIPESKIDLEMPLSDYTDIVCDITTEKLTDCLITEPTAITVNGWNAYLTKISGAIDGVNIYYWIYTVDCPDHLVQIVAWTLKSKKEAYEADIDAIVHSLVLTPTVPSEPTAPQDQ